VLLIARKGMVKHVVVEPTSTRIAFTLTPGAVVNRNFSGGLLSFAR
jgi:hypothetical protein